MEDNKIRVGITTRRHNGVGYEVILKNVCRPGDAGIVHADYLRFA